MILGQYFYFSEDEFNKIAGNNNWNNKVFEVTQDGSDSWTGQIIVWKGDRENKGAHGRRNPIAKSKSGQWKEGDTITLRACFDEGNAYDNIINSILLLF